MIEKVYNIYIEIFKNPFAIKNYRDLETYYKEIGKDSEAKVFHDYISDSISRREEPRGNN